jgi:hypothetical protein
MDSLLFKAAAESGNLQIVQAHDWDSRKPCRDSAVRAMCAACKRGHLHVAQWLHATFGLTTVDARANNNIALCWACEGGHLQVAQWLHATFGLTAADARGDSNYALRWACVCGHLQVVQWLHRTFRLTVEDAREYGNCALRGASANGHLQVVQWLVVTYNNLKHGRSAHTLEWTHAAHRKWYWLPHAVALAAELRHDMLIHVLQALSR